MSRTCLATALTCLALLGCEPADSPPPVDAGPPADGLPGPPPCGVAPFYSSVEDRECGIGPNGPSLCPWTLSFGGEGGFDSVRWTYSDVFEMGTFECFAGRILAELPTRRVQGTFNSSGSRLVWDGVEYAEGMR